MTDDVCHRNISIADKVINNADTCGLGLGLG